MEKKEIRILKSDIEVPAVVQRKADVAFAQIKEERTEAMKDKNRKQQTKNGQGKIRKLMKPLIAAAACAALLAGIGIGSNWGNNGGISFGGTPFDRDSVAENQISETESEKTAVEEIAQTAGNWFTLTACAKELEPGKPVPLAEMGDSGRSWVLGGSGDRGVVDYCIGTDFLCQGENIERVSYSINRGAFQIVEPIDPAEQIVVEGQLFEGELNTGSIGGAYDESTGLQEVPCETALYQSFTLNYDRQSSERVWINICNECPDSGEIFEMIWGDEGEATPLEKMSEGINRLLDGTVITCTAHYVDGTSQSVEIAVSSSVMTYGEAGADGAGEIPQDTEGVFITFEAK